MKGFLSAAALVLFLGMAVTARAQTCQQNQLHDEFYLDITSRGYVTCASDGNLGGANVNDVCVEQKFNAPCTDNSACKTDQTVTRETIWEVIDPAELETLARSTAPNDVARIKQLDLILHNTTSNLGKAAVRQKWNNVFASAGSPLTNAAIAALQQKNVPRSTIVCNRPGTLQDISCGLRGACK